MFKKLALITTGLAMVPLGVAFAQEVAPVGPKQQLRLEAQAKREAAQAKLQQRKAEFEQKKADLQAKIDAKKDKACQKRLDNLGKRVSNADKRKKGLLTHYTKAQEHLQRLIDRGKTVGVDVSKLEADLVEYKAKVDILAADFDAQVETTQNTQTLDCDQPKETLKTAHQDIQAAHKKVVEDRKMIHDFYKNTMRPHIVEVIKAIGATKSESEKSESNTGGGE